MTMYTGGYFFRDTV